MNVAVFLLQRPPPHLLFLSPLSEELKLASHTSQVTPLTQMRKLHLVNGFGHGEDLLPAVNSSSSDGFSSYLNVCICVFAAQRSDGLQQTDMKTR